MHISSPFDTGAEKTLKFPVPVPFRGSITLGRVFIAVRTKPLPRLEVLKEYLDYDPDTGVLACKKKWNCKAKEGPLGIVNKSGHLCFNFMARSLYIHRVAYKIMTGNEPVEVDHKDGCPGNNKFSNLRAADRSQQMRNVRVSKNCKSGVKGVWWNSKKKKWVASLMVHRKTWVKYFSSIEEAAVAVRVEREKIHGEFARHG